MKLPVTVYQDEEGWYKEKGLPLTVQTFEIEVPSYA